MAKKGLNAEIHGEKVLNVAQDVMTATTNIAMPKHVGLALYILKQTRSKELLTMLNIKLC